MPRIFGSFGRTAGIFWLFVVSGAWNIQAAQAQYNKLAQIDGPVAGDKLGWSVAAAGDVNGDGAADYIMGMPYYDASGLATSGAARVYSGSTGSLLYQKNGSAAGEGLGYYVGGAGDVNGDGRADFIVASQSSAFVFSGATGALLWQKPGGGPVAGLGDANGDGRSDFAVSDNAQTLVYSGATGAMLYAKIGGSSVAGPGDVNGDGRADFVVGDQYADPSQANAGSAWVYSGANGSLIWQKNGVVASDLLGGSVAGAGDVNGDGRPDVIIGARLTDNGGVNSGSAWVCSGPSGAVIYQKNGTAGLQLGQCVSGAGDADGDGRADFLISSIWTNPQGHTSAGTAFLYSGASGAQIASFDGLVEYENFGYTLAGLGDINGNGKSDFIVGGPNATPSLRINAGSAYVFGAGGSVVDPCANDAIPPTLSTLSNKTAGCGQSIVFDTPTASDNCDPAPVVSIVSTTQTNGPGAGEVTHTRTWVARDARGNTSAQKSQNIVYSCITQSATYRSQVTPSTETCSEFGAITATDLSEFCYSVRRNKISSCDPANFYYYVSLTAPSASFTVDIVQSRLGTVTPFVSVAPSGVKAYDNCAQVATGTSPSAGQARVQFTNATTGRQYVIAVLYSTSPLTGTVVGTKSLLQRYDFSAQINGQEVTRDAGGVYPTNCTPTKSAGPYGTPEAMAVGSYPNPFNAQAEISYALPEDGAVTVEIYNVMGQKVRQLVNENRSAGFYTVLWNGKNDAGRDVPSGMYFAAVRTRSESVVAKLQLLK